MTKAEAKAELLAAKVRRKRRPARVEIEGFCPHCGAEVVAVAEGKAREKKPSKADPRQLVIEEAR